MSVQRLSGVRVLVTRPEPAAGRLAEAFAVEGAIPVRIPAIVIAPVEDTASIERFRERLAGVAVVVFTSVNAVEGFFGFAPDVPPDGLPPVALAVGRATAEALRARRVDGVRMPAGRFDSEGLLACPELDAGRVHGRLVAIVKGEGGRGLLACGLRRRGAEVIEADVYRREAPEGLAAMLDGVREPIDVVTATSAEALDNLLGAAPWTAPWLSRRLLVTAGGRIAGIARARNLSRVAVAEGADSASIVEAAVRGMGVASGADRPGMKAETGAAGGGEVRKTMMIVNKLGLHARAAAKLVELTSRFGSGISIRREGREADAKSIMRVMMLAASKGTSIEVVARGDDAAEAVDAVERLVSGRFEEPE